MTLQLSELLGKLPASTQVVGDAGVEIKSIALDSRSATAGSLFVAVQGEHVDGHNFVNDAVANGASVIVADAARHFEGGRATIVYVPDTRRALSSIAAEFYGHPSRALSVIGVTGTNGKTTTTHMVQAILNAAERPCGLIGTVGASFADQYWTLSNTTPLPPELQGLLATMRDDGAQAVAMEVSSHALALERVEDVHFAVGALTNVTRDHLDFHQTMEAYTAAKRRLFNMCEMVALNHDDEHGERWAGELRRKAQVLTYSLHGNADIVARDIEIDANESRFHLDGLKWVVPLPGRFNISNALAAIGIARHLGILDETSHKALWRLGGVPGRMEYVGDGLVNAVVDYAHTPDALEKALWALREATNGVTLVFGCGGDRDRGKRPEMGRIAAQHARHIIVTSDNPRREAPMQIIHDIEAGLGSHPYEVEPDRKTAIERAVDEVHPGEILLIAGKGHEKYQIVGTETLPFDDAAIAREAIRARRLRK